ncbi:uncharacterized protein TRUGW13939_10644 [Talaromyces rugulosus]|uniref:Uncharacterized protein n=1 Tax=Talaromyces rugulosus TaxID=121627 RepID=A0A7H8RAL7_TALRU|nr:uncharacterized protein TRUGW13939_10644 [Talaromyces rugulosus]QKX63474.1 hypothetical protein TRUGW13939_10644 [Talaromyces rugulosus]
MQSSLTPQPLAYLMRYHRELFVDPLFWTSRHLGLVGCRFKLLESTEYTQDNTDVHQAQNNNNNNNNNNDTHEFSDTSHELVRVPLLPLSDPERFAKNRAPLMKLSTLYRILEYEGGPFEEHRKKGPKFFFSGQEIHRPKSVVFGRRKQASQPPLDDDSQILVGYFDYTWAICGRKDKFQARSHPGNGNNAPVGRLYQKRLAQITPTNWQEDPYFVCILLSIAQLQERSLTTKDRKTHTSRLLVAKWQDCEFIHLYEAQFTSELLEAIKNPKNATTYTNWPTITQKKIPFKPFDTFRQRLVAELLLPANQDGPIASDIKGGDVDVTFPAKRPHEQGEEMRIVRRKVDMGCGD